MNNLKQKTYKAFAWNFSGRIINMLISFIISIFLARILEPSDFGSFAIVGVIISFSHIFMDMGLGISIVQGKNLNKYHYGSVFWFNISLGILLSLLMYFSANLIASFYNDYKLISYIKVLSLLFVINSSTKVIGARLQKDMNMKLPVKIGVISSVISGSIGIAMAFLGYGIWSLIIQSLVSAIINNALFVILNPYKISFYFKLSSLIELWSFGFRMFISGLLDSVFINLDTLVIGKLFSATVLGFYNRAKNLNNLIIKNISASLMSVIMPALSNIQDEKERYNIVIDKTLSIVSFFAFGISGLLFITGKDLILIIYGEKWNFAGELFSLLMLSAFAYPISSVLVNILSSQGNSKAFLRLEIYKKLIYSLNFIFGFIWGIKGFVYGLIVVYTLSVLINIFMATKQMQLSAKWFNTKIWIYGLLAIIAAVISYLISVRINNIYIHIITASISYLGIYLIINNMLKLNAYNLLLIEIKLLKNKIIKNE